MMRDTDPIPVEPLGRRLPRPDEDPAAPRSPTVSNGIATDATGLKRTVAQPGNAPMTGEDIDMIKRDLARCCALSFHRSEP